MLNTSMDLPTIPALASILMPNVFFTQVNLLWTTQGFVNMEKLCKLCEWNCLVLQFQFVPYLFEPVEPLNELWENFAAVNYDEEELRKLSYKRR
jgi:hypothetical protein